MRTVLIATTLFTLAALCASTASAQQINIKPGLWQLEATTPGKPDGNPIADYVAGMKDQMSSMDPEQRKIMEATLADIQARGMAFTPEGFRIKECFTKENIANFELLGKKEQDSCTRKVSPAAGGVRVSMTCAHPQTKVEVAVKFQGTKAFTFESLSTVPGHDGKMTTQKTGGSGKWLSSDCGKVKAASIGE